MDIARDDIVLVGIFVMMAVSAAYFAMPSGDTGDEWISPLPTSPAIEAQCRDAAAGVENESKFQAVGADCECIPPDKIPRHVFNQTRTAELVENKTRTMYVIHCSYEADIPERYFPVRQVIGGNNTGTNQTVGGNTSLPG